MFILLHLFVCTWCSSWALYNYHTTAMHFTVYLITIQIAPVLEEWEGFFFFSQHGPLVNLLTLWDSLLLDQAGQGSFHWDYLSKWKAMVTQCLPHTARLMNNTSWKCSLKCCTQQKTFTLFTVLSVKTISSDTVHYVLEIKLLQDKLWSQLFLSSGW